MDDWHGCLSPPVTVANHKLGCMPLSVIITAVLFIGDGRRGFMGTLRSQRLESDDSREYAQREPTHLGLTCRLSSAPV